MKSVLDDFSRDDLPNEGLREMSDVIGINQVKALMVKCPGVTFHIPKDLYRQSDLDYIKKNTKKTSAEIAETLGLSERTIQRKRRKLKASAV